MTMRRIDEKGEIDKIGNYMKSYNRHEDPYQFDKLNEQTTIDLHGSYNTYGEIFNLVLDDIKIDKAGNVLPTRHSDHLGESTITGKFNHKEGTMHLEFFYPELNITVYMDGEIDTFNDRIKGNFRLPAQEHPSLEIQQIWDEHGVEYGEDLEGTMILNGMISDLDNWDSYCITKMMSDYIKGLEAKNIPIETDPTLQEFYAKNKGNAALIVDSTKNNDMNNQIFSIIEDMVKHPTVKNPDDGHCDVDVIKDKAHLGDCLLEHCKEAHFNMFGFFD